MSGTANGSAGGVGSWAAWPSSLAPSSGSTAMEAAFEGRASCAEGGESSLSVSHTGGGRQTSSTELVRDPNESRVPLAATASGLEAAHFGGGSTPARMYHGMHSTSRFSTARRS